jgi:hypothetical protein
MDEIILIGLYTLVFVGLPTGFGWLLYFVPKKLGYPNAGRILTITFGLVVLTGILWTVFQDQFFTKRNAKELVEEQQISLMDEFSLIENQSTSAPGGDYYHTFTLTISDRDKGGAVLTIRGANNFKAIKGDIDSMLYLRQDRYFGPKVVQNYETNESYVREYFQPSGKKGYVPTFRRISISKMGNDLTFEDISE